MKRTTSAGAIVTNTKGEVLLTTKKGIYWLLPKGHIEQGEELLESAKREVYEETGLPIDEIHVAQVEPLGSFERFKIGQDGSHPNDELKTIYFFHFTTTYDGTLVPIDLEHISARWFPRNEVPSLLKHDIDREFFEKAIQDIS